MEDDMDSHEDVDSGRMTLNQWRAKNDLSLYDMPEADALFTVTETGPVFLTATTGA
jgi:hypothetical protein